MGDPKFSRRKYDTPSHPWIGSRITEENEILKKFGLKNKREIWKAKSYMSHARGQARHLSALLRIGNVQAEKESKKLLLRLQRYGIIPDTSNLDDVLAIDIENVLNRRLQTVVYHKGLSNTAKQARQFIVHGHIAINGKRVTIPGYLVPKDEEDFINYSPRSDLNNELHPMRPKPEGYEEPVSAPSVTSEEPSKEAPKDAPSKKEEKPEIKPAGKEAKPEDKPSKEEKPEIKPAGKEAKPEEKPAKQDKPETKPAEKEAKPEEKPAKGDKPEAKPAGKEAKAEEKPEDKKEESK